MDIAYYIYFLMILRIFFSTFPLANKSQAHSTFLQFRNHIKTPFLQFRNHIKTQFEKDIKCFQCDNEKDYDNSLFHQFCSFARLQPSRSAMLDPHSSSLPENNI